MTASLGLVFLVLILWLLLLIVGIVLIVTRRKQETVSPICGQCGYSLQGSTTNRCPECGKLFIEAGVVTQQKRSGRLWVGVGLLVAALVVAPCLLGSVMSYVMARRATAQQTLARQQAARARQVQDFLQEMLAQTEQRPSAADKAEILQKALAELEKLPAGTSREALQQRLEDLLEQNHQKERSTPDSHTNPDAQIESEDSAPPEQPEP